MDFEIASVINHAGLGTIDGATEFLCRVWFLIVLWTLLLALVTWRDRGRAREVAMGLLIALGLHFIISEGFLKHGLLEFFPKRVRPYMAHPDSITPVGFPFTDSSFPSSHASSTAAVLVVFAAAYPRARPFAALFLVIMCLSRVHDGMHYPTDVLAGSLLGVGYGLLAVRWSRRAIAALERRTAKVAAVSNPES